ncbi:hypothetical protein HDU67_009084 [Dinochytrium kinnereticum]|nr:hypothetical protein HDU67_009084 [Dinochytrium kinnereticum]
MVQTFVDKVFAFFHKARLNKSKRHSSGSGAKEVEPKPFSTGLKGENASQDTKKAVEVKDTLAKEPSVLKADVIVPSQVSILTTADEMTHNTSGQPFGAVKRPDPVGRAVAIHAWEPRIPDQLELHVGDKITVTKSFNDGWASGVNETRHKTGIFPIHCVDKYEPTGSLKSFESDAEAGEQASAWKNVGGLWIKEQ